ncbi:MAG: DUF2785 domain-containing protein [Planctomycetes bacterium]|nr:DUF2785 domain-containing protein [Planctomycetota bacterium]
MLRVAPSSLRLVPWLLLTPALLAQPPELATLRGWLDPAAGTPPAAELPALLQAVDRLLGATDPTLRDDLGFTLLARWLYHERCVAVPERRWLLARWLPRLREGIDTPGTDAVAARSFAALSLSLLVALDNDDPFLAADEFQDVFAAALAYLRDERDVRGHDRERGWLHSVAHTADLLKFALRSRHLTPAQQGEALAAIAAKLEQTEVALTHGEDARLARAVLSLLQRADLDRQAARRWLRSLGTERAVEPNAEALARAHNRSALLAQLHLLAAAADMGPRQEAARTLVLEALRGEPEATTKTPPTGPSPEAADPVDVASVDAIVRALYASISGPAGQRRDWARVRSLFHRHHRMLPLVRGQGGMQAVPLTVDDYVQRAGAMLERDGFFEQEIARQVLQFGDLVHVWSTYEARRSLADEQPFLRGINSIQLVREGGRWWVLSIGWEQEADAGPIPPAFLGGR